MAPVKLSTNATLRGLSAAVYSVATLLPPYPGDFLDQPH